MTAELNRIVIVGSGHAGVEAASALRQDGYTGAITLVGDEPHLPYQRPPLSKEFLKGPDDAGLPLKGEAFFPAHDIALRLGVRVSRIDRESHHVVLSDGAELGYDHLVLALGARNRVPPVPGLEPGKALQLRSLADARSLIQRLDGLDRAAIIGGGFIGLEMAALLRARGVTIDLIEAAPMLMGRVLSQPMSAFFREFHEALGTRLHLETLVRHVEHGPRSSALRLSNGAELEVDAVLVAAGVEANVEIAAEAGLAADNGILVDSLLATEDPAISAIGDCAAYPNSWTGSITRLESVQNAVDQARTLAARLTGTRRPYAALPWFWSHQGSARLQIAGMANGHNECVLRGDPASQKFSIFLYAGERLVAVESVNSAAEHMAARRLLSAGISVPKQLAADPDASLKPLIPV
ncbi:NAD(P)-binding protein [Mesorhizobium sp. NBSH29]|uniref:NAD(P)/FAD-dependent oxidoreductase n=1 Tax=Mesorhizobium sp. NBSH29 TaxID=2654249 RepID=UPI00189695F2|nr:FAD-dependent oxidoreductase [Mesorhizobium sp. NBSH29]QPC88548.1 NAD(P)-binding protein [Mesorhizobium sp. NBSH29]